MDGEITLGGLHMIHERNARLTCGPIMAQGGIQAMETMLFTIDHINKQDWWIKNITLGNKSTSWQYFVLFLKNILKIDTTFIERLCNACWSNKIIDCSAFQQKTLFFWPYLKQNWVDSRGI